MAAGLSASALFALVAALTLGAPQPTAAVGQPIAAIASPHRRVVVIIRRHHLTPDAPALATPAPRAATPVTAEPVTAAPVSRPAPVTTSKSS